LRAILREGLEGALQYPNLTRAHLSGLMEGNQDTVFARRFRGFVTGARDALARAYPAVKTADLELKLTSLFLATLGFGLLGGLFADFSAADLKHPDARERYLDFLMGSLGEPRSVVG
jgi:hypothetical protein